MDTKKVLVISYTNFMNYINGYLRDEDIMLYVFYAPLPPKPAKYKCPDQSQTNSSQI